MEQPLGKISISLSFSDFVDLVLARLDRIEQKMGRIEQKISSLNLQSSVPKSIPEPANEPEDESDGETEDLLKTKEETPNIRLARLFERTSREYNFFSGEFNAAVEASHIYELIEKFGQENNIELPLWNFDFLAVVKNNQNFAAQLRLMADLVEQDSSNLTDPNLFENFGQNIEEAAKRGQNSMEMFKKVNIETIFKNVFQSQNVDLPVPELLGNMQNWTAMMSSFTELGQTADASLFTLFPLLKPLVQKSFVELVSSEEIYQKLKEASKRSNFVLLLDFKSYDQRPILDVVRYAALLAYLQEKCDVSQFITRAKVYLLLLRLAANKPLPNGLTYEENETFYQKFLIAAQA